MSTSHPRFTARMEGSPETIFDLVADMPNYGRWLAGSDAFGQTTELTQDHQIDLATALGEDVPDVSSGPQRRTLRERR